MLFSNSQLARACVVASITGGPLVASAIAQDYATPPITATQSGGAFDDFFFFDGVSQPTVSGTIVNSYSGSMLAFDLTDALVNSSAYDGMAGLDLLFFSDLSDVLTLRDETGAQVLTSVEVVFAGEGSDLIRLDDSSFVLGDLQIIGGSGDDVIWLNAGNDIVFGDRGDDHLMGGPGGDQLFGDQDNDTLYGQSGDDLLQGGSGTNTLLGGVGSDTYDILRARTLDEAFSDTIIEIGGFNDIDTLDIDAAFDEVTLTQFGNDLVILLTLEDLTTGAMFTNDITIVDQYLTLGSGLNLINFSDGTVLDISTVPSPASLTVLGLSAGAFGRRRRSS